MTIEITYDKALSAMRAAVAERGADYVYPENEKTISGTCQYLRPDGKASCIVGEVLLRLEVPAESLPEWSSGNRNSFLEAVPNASSLLKDLHDKGVIELARRKTLFLLDTAQEEQDNGQTWGVALERAEHAVTSVFPEVS